MKYWTKIAVVFGLELDWNEAMLTAINNAITTPWDTTAFFSALHEQIKQVIGDYAFIGAIYDEQTASIQIPYMHEEGELHQLESFPIGEGLTSILLRNKKPLLLKPKYLNALILYGKNYKKPLKNLKTT